MSVTALPKRKGTNLQEVLWRLGNIPLERVIMDPPPGTATEADVLAYLDAADKRICELVDGVLVEKPMGYRESRLALFLATILDQFIRPRNLGLLSGPDGTLRIFSGRVRAPDVAFISWSRLPGGEVPDEPIPDLVPDLAVEVWSISNTKSEIEIKRNEYLTHGVRLIWEFEPDERTINVFHGAKEKRTLTVNDILEGADVLPGFTVAVADIFAELDRRQ